MCKKSETIANLAKALVGFNNEVKIIEKDANNPHFKNKYASLDTIVDEVRPILAKHGLSIIQMPGGDGERFSLTTMLLHESGEWIESDALIMRPVKNDPQGIGSCTTYARRYSISAFLNLNTGDDDDGNGASTPPGGAQRPQAQQQTNTQTSQQSAPQGQQGGVTMVSEAQVRFIGTLKSQKKISDEFYRDMIAPKSSTKDLTKTEAIALINKLQSIVTPKDDNPDDLPF